MEIKKKKKKKPIIFSQQQPNQNLGGPIAIAVLLALTGLEGDVQACGQATHLVGGGGQLLRGNLHFCSQCHAMAAVGIRVGGLLAYVVAFFLALVGLERGESERFPTFLSLSSLCGQRWCCLRAVATFYYYYFHFLCGGVCVLGV